MLYLDLRDNANSVLFSLLNCFLRGSCFCDDSKCPWTCVCMCVNMPATVHASGCNNLKDKGKKVRQNWKPWKGNVFCYFYC